MVCGEQGMKPLIKLITLSMRLGAVCLGMLLLDAVLFA